MKNAWKGLIIGALTGMAGGSVMDMAAGARRKAGEVAHEVIDKTPSVAKAATHKAADVLHHTDVPETVREVAQHIGESPIVTKARNTAGQVAAGLGY